MSDANGTPVDIDLGPIHAEIVLQLEQAESEAAALREKARAAELRAAALRGQLTLIQRIARQIIDPRVVREEIEP